MSVSNMTDIKDIYVVSKKHPLVLGDINAIFTDIKDAREGAEKKNVSQKLRIKDNRFKVFYVSNKMLYEELEVLLKTQKALSHNMKRKRKL